MDESHQIHLAAAKQQAEVDKLFNQLSNGEFHESMQTKIAIAVRFFGKNLVKLQECNETMLKLSRFFLTLAAEYNVKWSNRDYNAVLQLIIMLLLQRRDEGVIRQTASLLVDFANSLPKTLLKNLVKHHHKVAAAVLHKVGRVTTHYTQMKVLLVLKTILSVLDDGGNSIVRSEKLFTARRLTNEAVQWFGRVDCDNFVTSSCEFLSFLNGDVIQKGFVQTVEGFLLKVDAKDCPTIIQTSINFGLGNLSLSFFMEAKEFSAQFTSSELLFVELEDCEIKVNTSAYRNPDHIHLVIKPMRHQILDKDDKPVNYPINSMEMVVVNQDNIFMSKVNPYFEIKSPMAAINLADNESMLSFRTVNTSIVADMNYCAQNQKIDITEEPNSAKDVFTPTIVITADERIAEPTKKAVDEKQEEVQQKSVKSEPRNKIKSLKPLEPLVKCVSPSNSEPDVKRQTAKIMPTVSTAYARTAPKRLRSPPPPQVDYDDVPNDDEVLPPFRTFMRNKRDARQQLSQENRSPSSQFAESRNLIMLDKPDQQNLVVNQTKKSKAKKPKMEAKKPNTQRAEKHGEQTAGAPAAKKAAPRSKISLRDPPKRTRNFKATTYETSSEEDLDAFVIQELENRESRNVKANTTRKVGDKIPQAAKNRSKRNAFAEVQNTIEVPAKNVQQPLKRRAAEPAPVRLPPKQMRKEDFDKLLDETKSPKEAQPIKPTREAEESEHQEIVELDEFIPYTQAPAKTEVQKKQIEPPTRKTKNPPINEHNSFKPKARPEKVVIEAPKVAREPPKSKTASDNSILEKFLCDSVSRAAESSHEMDEMNEIHNFEKMTMNTHTIYERSPTDIRKVEIREVTYKTKPTRAVPAITGGDLRCIFEQKMCEETEAALEDIRLMKENIKSEIGPERAAVLQSIAEGRELLEKSQRLAEEHGKLFKRLHQLESQIEQNCEDIEENVKEFVGTYKAAAKAKRDLLLKHRDQLDAIGQDLDEKEKSIKAEVWNEYLNGITRVVDSHRNL